MNSIAQTFMQKYFMKMKNIIKLIPKFFIILTVGSLIYLFNNFLDIVILLPIAASIHLSGEIIKKSKSLSIILLTVSFSLYVVIIMKAFENYSLIAILILGGLFELFKQWFLAKKILRYVIPSILLAASLTITSIPNILLEDKYTANVRFENASFFFRGINSQSENLDEGVIIAQYPARDEGILGTKLMFAWFFPHNLLSFLNIPVWPTMYYEISDVPVIQITHLRKGIGKNDIIPDSIDTGRKQFVSQLHRIYGTFKNFPKNNEQLYFRVLVKPSMKTNKWSNKFYDLWWVQADKESQDRNAAELKLTYKTNNLDGCWYADCFFGTPQDRGQPFEINAVITSHELYEGEYLFPEKFNKLKVIKTSLTVYRGL